MCKVDKGDKLGLIWKVNFVLGRNFRDLMSECSVQDLPIFYVHIFVLHFFLLIKVLDCGSVKCLLTRL